MATVNRDSSADISSVNPLSEWIQIPICSDKGLADAWKHHHSNLCIVAKLPHQYNSVDKTKQSFLLPTNAAPQFL